MEVDDVRELKEFGATDAFNVARNRKEENRVRHLVAELVREYENLATTLEENEALRARVADAEQAAGAAHARERAAAKSSAGLRVGVTKALETLQELTEEQQEDPGIAFAARFAEAEAAAAEQRQRAEAAAQEARRLAVKLEAMYEREEATAAVLDELDRAAEDFFESRGGRELVRAYRVLEDKLFDAKHPEAAAAEGADDPGDRPL